MNKKRRPAGVSRRQKQQLAFETLEDRRVMSADSGVVALAAATQDNVAWEAYSLSTNDEAGQLAILQNELYWQALAQSGTSSTALNALRTLSVPTDPLVGSQWHLINSGQQVGNPDFQPIFAVPGEDINVAPVWDMGYTGEGVVVAVLDSGVQRDHPDLAANIHPTLGFDSIDLIGLGDPDLSSVADAHGTAVAGLIGAVANNGLGGTGVAPGVTMVPIRIVAEQAPLLVSAFADAFRYETDVIDITNNSWGPGIPRALLGPDAAEIKALRDSVFFGRGGLGVVHVFASGNSAGAMFSEGFQSLGDLGSTTYDGWVNTRYTIGVTGVDHDGFYNNFDGTVTDYPETSASVLVAAPTGSHSLFLVDDTGVGSGLVTTDLTGEFGYNVDPDPDTGEAIDPFGPDYLPDTDYTSRFNGTSGAAPIATGVVALMLEANPNLTWRDVQEILVRSARQNAPFDVPTNGLGQGLEIGTQNTWIMNQMPVFHDPDVYDSGIPVLRQRLNPTLDPNLGPTSYQPITTMMTNGAGYTISQGKGVYGEMIGYAHGVVDAEMAVQLAEQWHTKNQALPSERTFTTFVNVQGVDIPAAETYTVGNTTYLVPGGLGGEAGFVDYWAEYDADDPFADGGPALRRGTPLPLSVPETNNMTIETVEVKVDIAGGTADALDNLRILLVSPDGTHQELNHFFVEDPTVVLQNESPATFSGDGISNDLTGGSLIWTFSSNRSWGERSDDNLIFNETTGVPFLDNGTNEAFSKGWELHFENYGSTPFVVNGLEVAWHGSPIGASTQRIQGFVGIDSNQDDAFNYSRVTDAVISEIDSDPGVLRYGEISNTVDETPLTTLDAFAGNVTVVVRRASDNVVVDRFVTGADGNYYFDLVPDDYIVSIEDPEGRVAKDDTTTGAGLLQHYQTEWEISADFFKVWQRDASLEVPVDGSGTPLPWLDGNGAETEYHVKGVNFLLDPGAPVAAEANFSGVVFADMNGDGVYNADDVLMPNIGVFADANRNGVRDGGETLVETDATGAYTLTVPLESAAVLNITVDLPANWEISAPATGVDTRFANLGDSFTDVDFGITPPLNSAPGVGIAQPGIVLGIVYDDANTNAARNTGESGIPGITVYLDNNNSGVLDAGDTQTVTNEFGAFVFTEVPPQTNLVIRAVVNAPYSQVTPFFNGPYTIDLASGDTFSGVAFGLKNAAVDDYGDLPAVYGATLFAENGARHKKGIYFLGAEIDADANGQPNLAATGDDINGLADEDGVTIAPLVTGTNTASVVTSRHGGWLTGWIDFNDDGDFDDVGERLEFTHNGTSGLQIGTKVLLDAGTNTVSFEMPAGVTAANVYARFRYGDFSVDSIFGYSVIGEVEDYLLPVTSVVAVGFEAPDSTGDGQVTGFDFLAWQRGAGMTGGASSTDGDANGDADVDGEDLAIIMNHYGEGVDVVANLAAATGDFDADGSVTGSDFLAMQRGMGKETGVNLYSGDGDGDGDVDQADVSLWQYHYGQGPGGSGIAAAESAAAAIELTSIVVDPAATTTISQASAVDIARFAAPVRERLDAFERIARRDEAHETPAARGPIAPLADLRRDDALGDFVIGRRRQLRHEQVTDWAGSEAADEALADALADEAYWRFG